MTWTNTIDRCPLWEGGNMPIHRKFLVNMQTSCKGFRRSSTGMNSLITSWHSLSHIQCAPPVFKGVLRMPRENALIRTLLFNLATWHTYAKLRLHMDTMLDDFRTVTTTLGRTVWMFIKEVCSQYNTTKLPHEMAAWDRREATLTRKSDILRAPQRRLISIHKQINLSTYKYHALGDYPDLIARFGTTDNASTQTVWVFSQLLCCPWHRDRENSNTRWSNVTLHILIEGSLQVSLQQPKYMRDLCNVSHNASQTVHDCLNLGDIEGDTGSESMMRLMKHMQQNPSQQPCVMT